MYGEDGREASPRHRRGRLHRRERRAAPARRRVRAHASDRTRLRLLAPRRGRGVCARGSGSILPTGTPSAGSSQQRVPSGSCIWLLTALIPGKRTAQRFSAPTSSARPTCSRRRDRQTSRRSSTRLELRVRTQAHCANRRRPARAEQHVRRRQGVRHDALSSRRRCGRANVCTLRLYSAYGPWEEPKRLIPALAVEGLHGRFPPLVDPQTARDFVWVGDIVDAYVLAARAVHAEPGAVSSTSGLARRPRWARRPRSLAASCLSRRCLAGGAWRRARGTRIAGWPTAPRSGGH